MTRRRVRTLLWVLLAVTVGFGVGTIISIGSAGLPLKISLPRLALPLTAVIAAGSALLGVGVERFFDLRARREDRRANLLRDVYFEAWDSIQRDLVSAVQFATLAPSSAAERPDRTRLIVAYPAKVYTIGSIETIRAFDELRYVVLKTTLDFGLYALKQGVRSEYQKRCEEKIDELVARESEDGLPDEEKERARQSLKEWRARYSKAARVTIDDLQGAVQAVVRAGREYEEKLAPTILAARRDLGVRVEEEAELADLMKNSVQRIVKLAEPLLKYTEELKELAKLAVPERPAPSQDESGPEGPPGK